MWFLSRRLHSRSAQESWASRSAHDRVDGKGSWFGWVWFRSRIWFLWLWFRFRIWFYSGFGFGPGFGFCVFGFGFGFGFILDLVSVPDLVSVFLVSVPDLVLYWIWFRSRI